MGGQVHQVSPQPPFNRHRLPSPPPFPLRYVVPEGEPHVPPTAFQPPPPPPPLPSSLPPPSDTLSLRASRGRWTLRTWPYWR